MLCQDQYDDDDDDAAAFILDDVSGQWSFCLLTQQTNMIWDGPKRAEVGKR